MKGFHKQRTSPKDKLHDGTRNLSLNSGAESGQSTSDYQYWSHKGLSVNGSTISERKGKVTSRVVPVADLHLSYAGFTPSECMHPQLYQAGDDEVSIR